MWEGSLGPLSSQTSSSFDAWQKAKTEERYERKRQKERVGKERESGYGKTAVKVRKLCFCYKRQSCGKTISKKGNCTKRQAWWK